MIDQLKKDPDATAAGLVATIVIAVFAWLFATDPDREPASASSTVPATAPSVAAATTTESTPDATGQTESPAGIEEAADKATPESEPTPEPSESAGFAAGSDHAQAPEAGDWREPDEKFAAAYYDTHGGDKEAWLAGMEPYVTEDLHENFTYTHIANVVDAEVESVESVQIESPTMTFKIHTAAGDDQTIALMELQPSGDWLVSAVGLTSTDLE